MHCGPHPTLRQIHWAKLFGDLWNWIWAICMHLDCSSPFFYSNLNGICLTSILTYSTNLPSSSLFIYNLDFFLFFFTFLKYIFNMLIILGMSSPLEIFHMLFVKMMLFWHFSFFRFVLPYASQNVNKSKRYREKTHKVNSHT